MGSVAAFLLSGRPIGSRRVYSANIFVLLAVFLTLLRSCLCWNGKFGRIQNRYGRTGRAVRPFQPIADGIKMLIKEDIVPARADKIVHFLAPILIAATAILALGIIPYGRNMTPFTIDGGILFFFAVGSTTELAVFMAGWGSNNKFSMLGAMRAIAQMISYELPLIITVLPVVMIVGSLTPDAIVAAQDGYAFGFVPRWFVFTPWGAAAFILFFVSGLVESNRTPFDVPGRRIGNCRRTHDGIFRVSNTPHFSWRNTLGMFAISGLGCDAVSRRLARADRACSNSFHPTFGSSRSLSTLLFVYIWLRGTLAAHARRSDHEFRLEIHAADGVHLHRRRRRLALRRSRLARMALVARRDRSCLLHIVDLARHAKEIRAAHLSFRRMNSAAFVVIAILTLAAALWPPQLCES